MIEITTVIISIVSWLSGIVMALLLIIPKTHISENRKAKIDKNKKQKEFDGITKNMKLLLDPIKRDLNKDPDNRRIIFAYRSDLKNADLYKKKFHYLKKTKQTKQIIILKNNKYVDVDEQEHKRGKIGRTRFDFYIMSEDFVKMLKK